MSGSGPFYSESTRGERCMMYLCIGGNILVICFCVLWLLMNGRAANLPVWGVAVAALAGYFLADVVSGLVHWVTDTWFHDGSPFGRWFAIAREHHTHPEHILSYSFYEHATVGSVPSTFIIGPVAVLTSLQTPTSIVAAWMLVYLVIAICGFFGTTLHNLGHFHTESRFVRFAQRWHLVLSAGHHDEHHSAGHTVRYCTVNGWANYLLDGLKVWRGLEYVIHRFTGAIPRENDEAWRRARANK